MEHNAPYIWSLPQEINELIFSNISATDLLKLRSVSKSVLESLSNQRLWKAACVSEFDLEFIDENANWIKLALKYGAINYNIRKARVLVQALAVNRISSDNVYTGESYILDDQRIVVNWLRTTERGSGANDNNDHSAILNIETRKEEQSILLGNDRSLIVIGNRLAELDWNGYSVRPFYNNILLSNLDQPDATKLHLPTKDARTVLTNQDPTKKHLVVVFESQIDGKDVHVTLHVHDLNTMQRVKSFSIKNFFKSRYVYSDPNVVFRGSFIYALQSEAKVLHKFNLNESAHDVADQIQLDIESTMATLFGVHKSLVFGYCRGNEHSSLGFPWLYDLKAKQLRYYPENLRHITNMMVHCGVLVVNAKNLLRFIDYRSDPNQLKLISTLQLDEVYRSSLQCTRDGKLFLSGYNSGAKLIDFEHANDSCEILFVNKTTTQRKKKTISIKAFELMPRAKELLGTHEFVSRYFKMSASQRFGIIYLRNQNKNSSIEVSLLHVNALNSKKPEYNTPYMYYTTLHDPMDEKERVVWTVPTPVPKQFYSKVIIFYEEFNGTRWKLSTPKHWITEKTSRNSD